VDGVEYQPAKIQLTYDSKDIYAIKRAVKLEFDNQLKGFDASELQVISGIDKTTELATTLEWDLSQHGGGKHDPLIIKVVTKESQRIIGKFTTFDEVIRNGMLFKNFLNPF
jgi:hypothetical protein